MRVIAALTLMAGLGMAGAAHALPIAPAGTEGRPVLLATTGVVSVTYQGTSASFTDQLFLASPAGGSRTIFDNQATPVGTTLTLGTFDAGTELLFGIDSLLATFGPMLVHICGSPHKFKVCPMPNFKAKDAH